VSRKKPFAPIGIFSKFFREYPEISEVAIMAYTIRVTFSFYGQAQGWSETFAIQSPDGNLTVASAAVLPLAQKRAKLLANGYVLQIVRCSVVIDNDGHKVLRQGTLAEPNYTGIAAWAPATPNLALLTEWSNGADTFTKKQYLRGIPAGLGDQGKIPDFATSSAAAWASNWNAWTSAMVNFPCGWIGTTVSASAVINAYVVDADTAQVTFTLAGAGIPALATLQGYQQPVYVKLPGKNPLDGRLAVVGVTATSCFTVNAHPAPPLPAGQLGIMTTRGPGFISLAPAVQGSPAGSIDPQRIISHKTGRPTYASRGRKSATVRW
jgi:hypothetical protein